VVRGGSPSRAAPRDVNLKFDQIEPGGAFRHRMSTCNRVFISMNEKRLSGWYRNSTVPALLIARSLTQAHRRFAQRLILLRRKRRRGRFLENFLVAALDGAVAHAGGPRCSVVVGDDWTSTWRAP
jgi:hypothetical protein